MGNKGFTIWEKDNAVLRVVQGGGKVKSLGAWWILIKEHNIIGS
jgi:hypothetical protein